MLLNKRMLMLVGPVGERYLISIKPLNYLAAMNCASNNPTFPSCFVSCAGQAEQWSNHASNLFRREVRRNVHDFCNCLCMCNEADKVASVKTM